MEPEDPLEGNINGFGGIEGDTDIYSPSHDTHSQYSSIGSKIQNWVFNTIKLGNHPLQSLDIPFQNLKVFRVF